eukprot:8853319-Alexandrium_andersonii.AAC.1
MDLIGERGRRRAAGDFFSLRQLNKDFAKSARKDKANWILEGIAEDPWRPVKLLSRKATPRV